MRVLYTVGSLTGGGAEQVVARLSTAMARRGVEVYVALIASPKVTYTIDESVKVAYVETKSRYPGLRYISRLSSYRKLVKHIKPDVVISFTTAVNTFVVQALAFTNIKIILSERNNPYVDPSSNLSRFVRTLTYPFADGFVFQTSYARDYFTNSIRGKSAVIINPLDNSLPEPFDGEREKTIVAVGRLEPQKNHLLLINAFARIADKIPDYKVEIYGEGSLRKVLQNRIDELGLSSRIKIMGYCDNVLERIQRASLYVLPSDYEGISNSLIEALAMGLPVISTDHPIGGARLLIESGENGIMVGVKDEYALSDAILRVILDKQLAGAIANQARKVIDKVNVDKVCQYWLNFITKIISL